MSIINSLSVETWLYIIFLLVLISSLLIDFGIFHTPKEMSYKSAALQSLVWVCIALSFCSLIYLKEGKEYALQYVSAYLMEYSLSIDNIFVFVLILTYFKVSKKYYHKVLFFGIIGAIIFRAIFILLGMALVHQFYWILYIFGAILIYTGYKILISGQEPEVHPEKNVIYKFMKKYFNILPEEGDGNFLIYRDGKKYYSILFLVIGVLASTDLVFAIDSIPAAFAVSQHKLVVLTSNIFAVMGLRAMFFLLMGAVNKFDYLQQGISFVLMFIGVKMLIEIIDWHIPTELSLAIIILMLGSSILLSVLKNSNSKK
ncbi:MAG: TerC/Alx family metal homeostasis membrane protein [Bacteroidota bacterium]